MLSLGVLAIFFLQFDDDLSPEVKAWMTLIEDRSESESEAFLYLIGIVATEGEDVVNVGKEIVNFVQEAEQGDNPDSGPPEFEGYPKSKHLKYPSNSDSIYCPLWEDNCLPKIVAANDRWQKDLNRWMAVYRRYLSFIEHKEFATLTKPHVNEIFPKYQYLTTGNRLRLFEAMSKASKGSPLVAVSMLADDIEKLRNQLKVSDNLVHKIIFTMLISYNLDAIVHIKSAYDLNNVNPIPQLSKDELSMELPIIREFALMYNTIKELDKHPDFFNMGGNAPGWLVRAAFKPNITINKSYYGYSETVRLSKLPANQFAIQVSQPKPEEAHDISLYNYAGDKLLNIAKPDFGVYIARVHDLNAKIYLVNHVLSDSKIQPINPYYPDVAVETPKEGKLCLDGPYPDERNLRCIFLN